ncbi:MAG: hypothetical protein KJ856_21050 [Gammaproteobacteria bacterium]|nr:hypothetical protein [Gammaproteobacteria bacterium]MBU1477728.1 hypothetical protein [Gammaproteobacteria bacterium]MBU2001059.1 hypothetical protein [Gammaproteobacteria bacterium]MBU2132381.1 hypothetical protein [Gammaproteobacteria bacterium]MBU2189478.1 hypothetical protein [Gammaproteobacteria bacterium]
MDVLSIVGSLASLWGAWYAWKQAKKSELAANLAERIKSQLIHHRDIEHLSQLEPLSKKSISTMRKYAVQSINELSGLSPQIDADHVQEYINEVYASSDFFPDEKSAKLYKRVNALIQEFVNANLDQDRKKLGNEIHNELVAFSLVFNKIRKTYLSRTE